MLEGMRHAFVRDIVETGRLPLFVMLVAIIVAFVFIRFSTRMIRAEVSWWPGNITPGGLHIHHVVFGLVFMLLSGFGMVALAETDAPAAFCWLAAFFGIGTALVLDEFAMVLHLKDVYWAEEGRASVDSVFVAIAFTGLFLMGFHPLGFAGDFDLLRDERSLAVLLGVLIVFGGQLALAVIVLLKGKVWTGLVGLFFPPLLAVGATRLSRPAAPWARRHYEDKPRKAERAARRDRKLREPVIRRKIWLQEKVAGKFGPTSGQ